VKQGLEFKKQTKKKEEEIDKIEKSVQKIKHSLRASYTSDYAKLLKMICESGCFSLIEGDFEFL
jgi:hypothetical protein